MVDIRKAIEKEEKDSALENPDLPHFCRVAEMVHKGLLIEEEQQVFIISISRDVLTSPKAQRQRIRPSAIKGQDR